MEHDPIEYSATFTCHKCKQETDQRTVEWPPQIFVCGNDECGAIFKFSHETEETGEIEMRLMRYKL